MTTTKTKTPQRQRQNVTPSPPTSECTNQRFTQQRKIHYKDKHKMRQLSFYDHLDYIDGDHDDIGDDHDDPDDDYDD